jgi:hypothetical protein
MVLAPRGKSALFFVHSSFICENFSGNQQQTFSPIKFVFKFEIKYLANLIQPNEFSSKTWNYVRKWKDKFKTGFVTLSYVLIKVQGIIITCTGKVKWSEHDGKKTRNKKV